MYGVCISQATVLGFHSGGNIGTDYALSYFLRFFCACGVRIVPQSRDRQRNSVDMLAVYSFGRGG